jgi:hypothetical protein
VLHFVLVTIALVRYSSVPLNGAFGNTSLSAVPPNTALKVSVCPFMIVVPMPGVVVRWVPLVIVEPPTSVGIWTQVRLKGPQAPVVVKPANPQVFTFSAFTELPVTSTLEARSKSDLSEIGEITPLPTLRRLS